MAQWYAHLLLRGEQLLGEGLEDFDSISEVREDLNGDAYTAVVVSGYALYGKLRGFYALGVSQIVVEPETGEAYYATERSSLHTESVETLTTRQRAAIRHWLMDFDESAWENSTEPFKHSLMTNGAG